ncbi:MAG TPA: hypothetical protein PK544_06695 [Spirochaetota bacterium]|nr:hypothetical protein [Spirochaetota bacterium]HPJ37197.1 hypothetical protein [Spirochaetota bacterium]HPQ52333.1 hypothetical protein [Spirochaetota bacterium]
MKRSIYLFLMLVLMFSCKSPYELVRTGPIYPPQPQDAEVKIVGWGEKAHYEQIAIADVGEYTLDRRIQEAMKAAREAGGTAIMPKLTTDSELNAKSGFLVQSFLILKEKSEDIAETPEQKVATVPVEKKGGDIEGKTGPDYSNLPRAKYRLLLSDLALLKGTTFRGSMYPVRYYRVPRTLKTYRKTNSHLLLLSSRSGSSRVLLFLPKDKYTAVRAMIKSKKRLDFVYKPVAVYKSKFPVLEYVDTIAH